MTSIFISYNRGSVAAVESLARDLAAMGHAVWYDQALTGGQRWWDNILDKLRMSAVFMPILTPEALDSQACKLELKYAADLGKPLLPVLLSREVNPNFLPKPLAEIQFIDYCAQDKSAAFALMRALADIPVASALPDPLPDPPAVPLSYLGDLRERIDSQQPLNFQAQIALAYELKDYLQQQGRSVFGEISQLLQRFRQRQDLLARVATEIDSILDTEPTPVVRPSPASAPKNAGKAKSTPKTKSAPTTKSVPAAKPSPPTKSAPKKSVNTLAITYTPEASDDKTSLVKPLATVPKHSAAPVLATLLRQAIRDKKKWQVEADKNDHLLIDPSAQPTGQLGATLTVRDNLSDTKAKALKKTGWAIDEDMAAKSVVTGGALYATGGLAALALLSKTVRDELMTVTATKSWKRPDTDAETAVIADQLAAALEIIAPEAKTYTPIKVG